MLSVEKQQGEFSQRHALAEHGKSSLQNFTIYRSQLPLLAAT
jgi:hypothetical protein